MQIEWNTQHCKLFVNTQLIWWWKFPFSAIAKAGFDLCAIQVMKGWRSEIVEKLFFHCWIHSGTQTDNFTHSRRPLQLHVSRRKPQTNIKQIFEWFPWRFPVWLKTLKGRDFRTEFFSIKGAPFWRFSSCQSVNLVQAKSGGEEKVFQLEVMP